MKSLLSICPSVHEFLKWGVPWMELSPIYNMEGEFLISVLQYLPIRQRLYINCANYFCQKYHQIDLKNSNYIFDLPHSKQSIECFSIQEQIKQFWHHHICKHQNVTSTLVFTIVIGFHRNFWIVLHHFFVWRFVDPVIVSFLQEKCVRPKIRACLRDFVRQLALGMQFVQNC